MSVADLGAALELKMIGNFVERWFTHEGRLKAFKKDIEKATSPSWKWWRKKGLLGIYGADYKAAVFPELCRATIQTVKIANDLNDDVSNRPEYVDALRSCVTNPNIKVEILAVAEPDRQLPCMQMLIETGTDISIRQANEASKAVVERNTLSSACGELFQFALFDQNKYCVEHIPSKHVGIACFKDKEISRKYARLFDEAFKVAQPVYNVV